MLGLHYAEHEGKPFFEPLVDFMASGPVTAILIEGEPHRGLPFARRRHRPHHGGPGLIRGDLGRDWGHSVTQNVVHGSDSAESAEREIEIWFPELLSARSSRRPGRRHGIPHPRFAPIGLGHG